MNGANGVRLGILMMALGLASAFATGLFVQHRASQEVVGAEETKLFALMEVRRDTLSHYLESTREEVRFWAKNRIMRGALVEFTAAWEAFEGDRQAELQRLYIRENPFPVGQKDNLEIADDDSHYSLVHSRYHHWLRSFLIHRGVYDVFLFDQEGNLVYTSLKEDDFATNLLTGPWKDTDLGRAFREARDNPFPSYVAFFDFAPYEPSHGEPASFISAPVLDDAGGFLGVLAFQLPVKRVNEILQVTSGMGETGETYAVGNDLLMRSDSRFSQESTVLQTTVDTSSVAFALEGKEGLHVTDDYRGIPVYSAYGPMDFEDVRWAVLAEIDEDEVRGPIERIRNWMLGVALLVGLIVGVSGVIAARGFGGSPPPRDSP